MSIIFITGLKHSGKSTLGRLSAHALASTVSVDFYDTDELIEAYIGPEVSVREFYRLHGVKEFQALEVASLHDLLLGLDTSLQQLTLIATGGGICDNEQAVTLMKQRGHILYLEVPEQLLFERIMVNGVPPFLDSDNPRESFAQLYEERRQRYLQLSDEVLPLDEGGTLQENAQLVTAAVRRMIGKSL